MTKLFMCAYYMLGTIAGAGDANVKRNNLSLHGIYFNGGEE